MEYNIKSTELVPGVRYWLDPFASAVFVGLNKNLHAVLFKDVIGHDLYIPDANGDVGFEDYSTFAYYDGKEPDFRNN